MNKWVDACAYWGRWGVRTPGVDDVETFVARMDRWNVGVAALTGLRALVDNTRLGNRELARVVRHHHERWDGQGYPRRLAGEDPAVRRAGFTPAGLGR